MIKDMENKVFVVDGASVDTLIDKFNSCKFLNTTINGGALAGFVCLNYTTELLPDGGDWPELEEPYPDLTQLSSVRLVFLILYSMVMVLAIFGNAAVCYTVLSNKKMKTVVNFYIVNLAACDLLVGGFVLPVKLIELMAPAEWGVMTNGLCTTVLYLQTVFVFASVLTLVATCLERYFAVVHPMESRMQQSKKRTIKILVIVWLLPCLAATPFLYPCYAIANTLRSDYGTITRLTCFTSFSDSFRVVYFSLLFVLFYIIPLFIIAWSCFQIAVCLLSGTTLTREGALRRQENNRRKVAKMVLVVVVAFTISWTPYFLVTIITQYQEVNFFREQNYFFTMLCINLFAFLNSSVNPFIYVAMSTRFRSGFLRIFRGMLCVFDNPESVERLTTLQNTPQVECLGRYRRQLVMLACRDAVQISSESGRSESPQSTFENHKIKFLASLARKSTPNIYIGETNSLNLRQSSSTHQARNEPSKVEMNNFRARAQSLS